MRHVILVAAALVAGAAGGVLSSRALPEARAQTAGAIVVPVPPDGVVFRASGGNAVARIRYDSAGGSFEVLDARQRVALRLRAADSGGMIELGAPHASAGTALPLVRSLEEPGY